MNMVMTGPQNRPRESRRKGTHAIGGTGLSTSIMGLAESIDQVGVTDQQAKRHCDHDRYNEAESELVLDWH